VFALVNVDLSKMTVPVWVDLTLWRNAMVGVFRVVRYTIEDILASLTANDVDLDNLAAQTGKIVTVFGLVAVDLSKLNTEVDLTGLGGWAAALITVFAAIKSAILDIIETFTDIADLEKMAGAAGNIISIVGIVKPALDAVEGLADYVRIQGLAEKAAVFATDLAEVIFQIVEGLNTSEIKEIPAATLLFATAVQSLLSIVKPALDAIAGLAEYVRTEDLEFRVANFGADLDIIIYELYKALQNTGIAEIPEATLKFAAAIQSMIGFVKPALDAIAGLADYVLTEGIEASVAWFGADLDIIVYELYKALQNTGIAEIPPATLVFAQAVTTIVGVVKPAIEAIADLANYETVGSLRASLENFGLRLGEVITAIVDLAKTYDLVGVEAAAKFATAAGTIIGVVTTAITAIAALAEYKILGPLGIKMQNVVDRLREILKKITDLSGEAEFSEVALSGAVRFAGQVNTIAGGLKTTIDSIEIIANYKARGDITTKMNDLVFRISEMLNKIITLKNTYDPDGISASRDFLAAVLEVERNVLLAMEAINNIATKPFTWGMDYNMTQFAGFIERLIVSLGKLFIGFDGMGLASAAMLVQAQAAIGNIRTLLESLASITGTLPGGSFPSLLNSYLWTAINVARQRLLGEENSMLRVFRDAVRAFGDAGRDAAAAWGNGFDAGNLRIPNQQGNQPVNAGGNRNVVINLVMNNNVANGMDVGMLNMQIRQVVAQAVGR